MKYRAKILSAMIVATLTSVSATSYASEPINLQVKTQNSSGSPSFVTGNLGTMTQKNASQTLKNILSSENSYGFTGNEEFEIARQWIDNLGKSHTHFTQTINGLKVYGTSMILHANVTQSSINSINSTSEVYALTGTLAVDSMPSQSLMMKSNNDSGKQALVLAKNLGKVLAGAELAYIYLPETNETRLAWRFEISWDHGGSDFGRDFVYFDANSLEILARHAQVHSTKSWKTYTLNGNSQYYAPGTLLCTNTQSCNGNAAAQRAHDGAAKVYDYYQNKFSRDSLDNNGMTMISSVELGDNNAYWTGSQMLYGKAYNGLNDYTSDFDIIGHELTHGVTQKTAGLNYQNASGALNEAWSDILGLSAEAYKNGTTSSTWLLGDALYNNQPGKAFRYMNNPTQDNYSKDYYPERIPFVSNPSQSNDYGGVHGNSGIANLAYVLLVDGGKHPRNKTTAQVPALGMAKSEQIFYRALTTYMTQNTDFSGARTATAQAAQDLYGNSEKLAVETAWCAVGVGTCPTGNPPPPPTDTQLQNGVAKTGISGSSKQQLFFTLEVPTGATDLKFITTGGTGDADLYVKYGARPSLTVSDCKGTTSGSSETCTISAVQAGTYHVMVEAWNAISGVSLTGSFTEPTTPPPTDGNVLENGVPFTNLTASTGSEIIFTMHVPQGATDISFSTSGGTGDVDMYVKFGERPTDSSYDCRPYQDGNSEFCSVSQTGGTYYIRLKVYHSFSGVTLLGQYNDNSTPPGNEPIYDSLTNLSVAGGQWAHFQQVLPAGYSTMTISIAGGYGDVDLYVRHGAPSTAYEFHCRPYKNGNYESCTFNYPAQGTWYIDLYGYQNSGGITLTLEANP